MHKSTFFSIGAVLALLFIGAFALKMEAGQEEDGRHEDNWFHRDHRGDNMHRHAPVVVYEHAFKGQTASIPLTTLFTADCSCLYRVSVYQEQPTVIDTLNLGPVFPTPYLSWTDGVAPKQQVLIPVGNATEPVEVGKPVYYSHQAMVHSIANQPIQLNVVEDPNDHSTYDVYVVVEEL